MSPENTREEDSESQRPPSPSYGDLRSLLNEAGVFLVPTDRDLAPPDHHNDEPESI